MAAVLPLTREWIEITTSSPLRSHVAVLPLTREWIEISSSETIVVVEGGSPSHEGVD